MNEERQARLLAEWLDGSADQLAPEGIDVDVLEAIYVVQPDRAPAPRVTLAEILAPLQASQAPAPPPRVKSLTPAELAAALAEDDDDDVGTEMFTRPPITDEGPITDELEDLDDGPVTDPDVDVDVDGPPTDMDLGLDAPLSGPMTDVEVTATSIKAIAPFSDPNLYEEDVTQAITPIKRPAPEAAAPPEPVDDDATPSNPLEVAFGTPQEGGFGNPEASEKPKRSAKVIQFTPSPRSAPPQASEFPAIDADEPEIPAEATQDVVVDLDRRRPWWKFAGGGGIAIAAAAAVMFTFVNGTMDEAPTLSESAPTAPMTQSAAVPSADAPDSDLSNLEGLAANKAAAEPTELAQLAKGDAQNQADGWAKKEAKDESKREQAAYGSASGSVTEADGDSLDVVADLGDYEDDFEEELAEEMPEEEEARFDKPEARPAAAAGAAAPEPDAEPARSRAGLDDKPADVIDLGPLRSSAEPRDYDDQWYLAAGLAPDSYQNLTQVLSEVATYTRFDEFAQAATACEVLIDDPDVRVGQDFAYRAASYAYQGGDGARAMTLIGRGLARSSANTFFLSSLNYLQGRIQEGAGDLESAERSYEAAKALNEARR